MEPINCPFMMGSYRYRWAPSLRLRHQGSFSPRLTNRGVLYSQTNRGVKTVQRHRPQWDWALLICARTASALAKKRSALQKKKGRVLAGPSAASACWTPLPFPGSGPGFVSPVATQWRQKNKKGGLGSPWIVKR